MTRIKKRLTCGEKVRLIYATQAMEDPSMSWRRALEAHAKVCKLGVGCSAGEALARAECDRAPGEPGRGGILR